MDKKQVIENLLSLSATIDVPLDEIQIAGSAWFSLQDFHRPVNDLNVFVPEKYLERIAKNEHTYFPKGSSRQTVASWFVPVAVKDTTAWIRPTNSFHETFVHKATIADYPITSVDSVRVTEFTLLSPLSMLIEKRGSNSAVKRSAEKKNIDYADIHFLNNILRIKNAVAS